ncbi:MAG: cysteine desulfurase-like protein [Planctomycetes bacterium]|nr:cysteine desulfurase-like protein [Planctomycetota bacterium]
MNQPLDVATVRRAFPSLLRRNGDRRAVYLDGPAGSQVPRAVADAVSRYLLHSNANHGGEFTTSQATDTMVAEARRAGAALFGADDPEEVVFGANMTTLTFHLARSLARTWRPGEEIVVTDSDHDANVTPWVLAARDAGCTVHRIPVRRDSTLDLHAAAERLGERCRMVAIGAASNLSGTIHAVPKIAELARSRGALTFVDAVHFAPHGRMDVRRLGADFAVCSAYKFFGPHVGLLYGRRALLEELEAYKVRTSPPHGAEKWQTGTANFEGIAGTLAAIDYLCHLGGGGDDRAAALDAAFAAIEAHERQLCVRLLTGLRTIAGLRVIGIDDPQRIRERCPTVSFVHPQVPPHELHRRLAEREIYTWAGNSYALALSQALGLEPDGVLRVGLLHYNTEEDVDLLLTALREVLA